MANIAPYARYRRKILNRKSLRFKTATGSYIYAPARGKAIQKGKDVIIRTDKKFVHFITDVHLVHAGHVEAGARIGSARGRKVIYSRYSPSGKQLDAKVAVDRKNGLRPTPWMPNVTRKPAHGPAGEMGPGDERVAVWHTSESDNGPDAIYGVVDWVRAKESEYTLVWNTYTGQKIQLFPAHVGARAMLNDGSYPVNRHGKIRIQICVVGRAADAPLKNSPLRGRRDIMAWLDDWGIPRKSTINHSRSRTAWERSGHTDHKSAPGNDHVDPGKIDFKKLFAP